MNFDIAMPAALFAVVALALFIDKRGQRKLKSSLDKREFGVRETALLIVTIGVMVSVIVFFPQMAVTAVFLFSYSMLLFIVSYTFSDMKSKIAQLFFLGFAAAGIAAGTISLLGFLEDELLLYGTLAFYGLAVFAFFMLFYELKRPNEKERWTLAILPAVLFLLLYLFFHVLQQTALWFPYLMNIFGVVFAVLIVLYLGVFFTWEITLVFAGLLTILDIILVLFTGAMVSAAKHVFGLGLPVLITLPVIPTIPIEDGVLFMSLGLGDFFFAGILAAQTYRKFGVKTALISALAMSLSFAVFEVFLLNSEIGAFPGTLMIIFGWLPIVVWKMLREKQEVAK